MHEHVTCPKCSHAFPLGKSGAEATDGEHPSHDATLPIDVGVEAPSLRGSGRGAGSPLTALVRFAVVSIAFAAMAATGVWLIVRASRPAESNSTQSNTAQLNTAQRNTQTNTTGPATTSRVATAAARTVDSDKRLSRIVPRVTGSIVKIESIGAEQTLGSGFVVDSQGLIATSFHVTSAATRGRVRFKSGAVYEIAGYAAVDPANDLALLRLRDAPDTLAPLPLRTDDDPAAMSQVVAIGHPQGVEFSPFDGRVSKILDTESLPEQSRQFLRRHMDSPRNHRWIQHTAGTSAGNSGGPLVNMQGEVVGVNTWVNTDTNYSYALHARYLADLLAEASSDTIPLEQYASGAARSEAAVERLARGQLEQLFQSARAMRWRPESESQYVVLERLASTMTIASRADQYSAGQIDAELREQLILEADQIEQRLRKEQWNDVGQFTIINDFAAQRVGRAMTGLFCFGTVVDVYKGDADAKGMLVRLAGGEETLFISLTGSLVTPEPGAHCLILGISTGRTVRFGGNPLKLDSAAEVVSRTILPLAP
ncbi:MAG: serine protease [Pirellulaceae bacterium]